MTNQGLPKGDSNPYQAVEANQMDCHELDNSSEIVMEYPQELGQGYIKAIELDRGFSLEIKNYQNRSDSITEESPQHEHPLQFYFRLAGYTTCNVEHYSVKAGETALCGCGMALGSLFSTPEPSQEIDIHIEPELFKILFGIQNDAIPAQLKHLFRQPDEEYSVRMGTITTQMQVALQQIWQCPFQGLVQKAYLKAKVLELMALRMQQDISGEIIQYHGDNLKRTVVEKIYQAREILESRLENPPSLIELSKNVGLSPYQLKQGFRKVFGQTAFQYLHQYRMEQARLLLYEGDMRVAEVANYVGYSHLGQFSAAFKRKFGISPRDCLKGKL